MDKEKVKEIIRKLQIRQLVEEITGESLVSPEEEQLEQIFDKHDRKYGSREEWKKQVVKDLLSWRKE
jgi:hypothetical protein